MYSAATVEELASLLAELGAAGTPVSPRGTGTRTGWGGADRSDTQPLSTAGLNRIREYYPADLTAVLEAGVSFAEAQATFAQDGLWLALDPADPPGTIGGLFATADSGPARHRFGAARDLIIGATVVLSDGTVATSGGRVIKNVAGYDLAKLFTGSRGTLGVLASVAVRLHPRPTRTVSVSATTNEPDALAQTAIALAGQPLDAISLDAWWRADGGGVLIRYGGVAAAEQASRTLPLLASMSAATVETEDESLWQRQRDGQRSADGVVLKVSGRLTDLPGIIAVARAERAHLVSRAGVGLSWLNFEPGPDIASRVEESRTALAPRHCQVLDGAHQVAASKLADPALATLTSRLKQRFDPAGIFRPGAFGGI